LVVFALAGFSVEAANPDLALIPWPKSVSVSGGELALTSASRIVTTDDTLQPLAAVLHGELLAVTGLDCKVAKDSPRAGDIVLSINKEIKAGADLLTVRNRQVVRTREGAHRLTVRDRVTVEGFDYRATAEGTATLLQAIRPTPGGALLPAMTIHDWPHADYSGAMIDVARQQNTIQDLRLMVEVCRAYKGRYLQLHLSDDQGWCFPSTAFPKLGTLNGSAHGGPKCERYSLDDLKSLVRYAQDRGVTLVPEIETPGHSSNARGTLPEIFGYLDPSTGKAVDQGIMNLTNPKLYEALDTIIGEVCEVFAGSPYFHIGYDEVMGMDNLVATPQGKEFMVAKGLANSSELANYFAQQLNEMVKKRGKKTIMWEGPANLASKDIIVMTWCGNSPTATQLTGQGLTTITVPWNLNVPWPEWTMYHSNGCLLKPGDSVLGAMLPVWEQKGEVSVRWLRGLPRRQARTWGPEHAFTEQNFVRWQDHTDRVLDRLLYGFAIRHEGKYAADFAQIKVTEPASLRLEAFGTMGKVHYTLDGSEPTANSPTYAAPLRIADQFTIKARVFDAQGQPAGPVWSQPYAFEPLAIQGRGMLKDSAGKDSAWFADKLSVSIETTTKSGTVRFTVDGSEPLPTSRASPAELTLTGTSTVKARWFDEMNVGRGAVTAATYQKLAVAKHAALGKPVRLLTPPDLENREAAAKLLTDGFLARGDDWTSPEVVRLGPKDLEVVIDLGAPTAIQTVTTRFLDCQEAGIFPAVRMDVQVSADGQTYRPLGESATYPIPVNPGSRGVTIKALTVTGGVTGRYVKVCAKNLEKLPPWHSVANVPSHMMLDEIMVNPEPAQK